MWNIVALCIFLWVLDATKAGAQTGFRADVLDVEARLSENQDLVVTVRNMSKLPSTLESLTAEVTDTCRYRIAVGSVTPGTVHTAQLATKSQIAACDASTLESFRSGMAITAVHVRKQPRAQIVDRGSRATLTMPP